MPLYFHRRSVAICLPLLLATVVVRADQPASKPTPPASHPSAANHEDNSADKSTSKPHVAVTISRATTYITEPLRKDGYPDYFAAIDERIREGLTVTNNSSVLFWQAIGPADLPPSYRQRFFAKLGIAPLPEQGDYFLDLDKFLARRKDAKKPTNDKAEEELYKEAWQQFDVAQKRPWSKQEFPRIAEWLAANEKPLALLTEGSQRPHRYDPLLCGEDESFFSIMLPAVQQSRNIAQTFIIRAMLRVQEGKLPNAWDDLLTCHRLARLDGQGGFLVEAMVAETLNRMACAADLAMLQQAKSLPVEQLRKMLADLDQLPPMPHMADKLEFGERLMNLNLICLGASKGLGVLDKVLSSVLTVDSEGHTSQLVTWSKSSVLKSLIDATAAAGIDWNELLRNANSRMHRLASACRQPTRAARKAEVDRITAERQKQEAVIKGTVSASLLALGSLNDTPTKRVDLLFAAIAPRIAAVVDAKDHGTMRFELTRLAFALAAYRAEHGVYPAKLADLAPKYLAQVPNDIFTDGPLQYRRQGEGYLLYSLGVNGKDDAGRGTEDRKPNESCDDLVVRMP